jgi:rhodanese-related sulfurtransferase
VKYLILVIPLFLMGQHYKEVQISPVLSSLEVVHKGMPMTIHRHQDSVLKLKNYYTELGKPNTTLQPISIHPKVNTIGEIEFFHFLKRVTEGNQGLVIDVRSQKAYEQSAIPTATYIPITLLEKEVSRAKLLKLLGFGAYELVIYADGLWDRRATQFIEMLLSSGYPAEKLYYYRGGMQMWQLFGFTVVSSQEAL